jgi:tetratricopeptide (TPR) repeat protein
VSYINEALKKAQRDKEARRIRHMGIRKNVQKEDNALKKIMGCILLSALVIGLGFMVYLWFDTTHDKQSPQKENALSENNPENTTHIAGQSDLLNKPVRKKVHQTTPKLDRIAPNTARLYDRAMDLFQKGRLQEAERLYKNVLRLDPTFSNALNDLGVIYIQKKNFSEAKECFEKAIQLQPNAVEPYYNLACLHSIKGELQEGLTQLSRAIALNPAVKEWMENDTDLVNLRGVPDFKDIIKDQIHD